MRKKTFILSLFLTALLFSPILIQAQENITITTYYPAPFGVYKNLRLFPHDELDLWDSCDNPGDMYYDASDDAVYTCRSGIWGDMTATNRISPIGYWVLDRDDGHLYPPDALSGTVNWDVGIGTADPEAKLHVVGDIKASGGIATAGYLRIYKD